MKAYCKLLTCSPSVLPVKLGKKLNYPRYFYDSRLAWIIEKRENSEYMVLSHHGWLLSEYEKEREFWKCFLSLKTL